MKFVLAAPALLVVASTNARRLSPDLPPGKNAKLEAEFPCLAPFVNKTVVDQYTEKDNTRIRDGGLISEVNGVTARENVPLRTQYDQKISKSEAKQICATKCTNILEDCTMFEMAEETNGGGKTRYYCTFHSDDSIASQHPVENPVKNINPSTDVVTSVNWSAFHKGEDLVLPEFVGCNVPVGEDAVPAVYCRFAQFLNATEAYEELGVTPEFCEPVLGNLTSDFENYIFPSVLCTATEQRKGAADLEKCLDCLANDAFLDCSSDPVCEEEDNIITKKCPDTCTSTGKVYKCGTCGNFCPQEPTCVAKLATAMLCQSGAKPKFDLENRFGGCMNADNPGFPEEYLATKGNGDYKCLNKTAVPVWVA